MSAARARERFAGLTDPGLVRTHNEDAFVVSPPLFAVADGLGGHEAGEIASRYAIDALVQAAPREAEPKALARAVRAANAVVVEAAEQGRGREGMGTTLTAAMVEGTYIAIAHVGDSRAYLLSGGKLERLTQDHSMVADMIRAGQLTEAEARRHPNRSVITRALGSDMNMLADAYEVEATTGDRLLLCSDGLHGMLTDTEIARILGSYSDPSVAARALVDAAIDAGGQDNITVIVVDIEGERQAHEAGGASADAAATTRRWASLLLWLVVAAAAVGGAWWAAGSYARSRAYLIDEGGRVVVYQGVAGSFAGIELSWRQVESTVPVTALDPTTQARLAEGIPEANLADALEALAVYRARVASASPAP
ncbi:MAG: protein phosphatase [Coriobacteriaceae bacterium]|nr:protein phosphatase [Coriobacteriaceae bacterium]